MRDAAATQNNWLKSTLLVWASFYLDSMKEALTGIRPTSIRNQMMIQCGRLLQNQSIS